MNGSDIPTGAAACAERCDNDFDDHLGRSCGPARGIAGCVFCRIVRDTRGVTLDHAERFDFFPASPLCSVAGLFTGDCHLIDQPDQMARPWIGASQPGLAFFGPQLGPLMTWNPGETYTIVIAFYPDAFSAITGLDFMSFTGRMVPAEEVLPQPDLEPCRNLFDAIGGEKSNGALSVLEDGTRDHVGRHAPCRDQADKIDRSWSRSFVLRAALTEHWTQHTTNRTADQIMDGR